MKINLKLRPFFKDISLTFFTEVTVLLSFFFVYRLIAETYGPEGVGIYSLIKRVIGFFLPFLIFGFGVGIPRYVAMSKDREQEISYLRVGFLIIGVLTLFFAIFAVLFKQLFAVLFFGSANFVNLVCPFLIFLCGLIFHSLIYSFFRGKLHVRYFNSLQIINLCLVPLAVLIFFKNITIAHLIILIGIFTFAVPSIYFLLFVKGFFINIQKWRVKKSFYELSKYGALRLPGDFILAGFFSLGPILITHFASIQEVGYLSISQSLLSAIGAALAPLGLVLLPRVSSLIINGEEKKMIKNLNFLMAAVMQCSIFICVQMIIFSDSIIKYWLGPEFLDAVPIMRITFMSTCFYSFYVAVRSILDAAKVKPLNAINLFISLGVYLTMAGVLLILKIFSPVVCFSLAFVCGFACLGILSYISIGKIFSLDFKRDLYHFSIALFINIFFAGLTILLKPILILNIYQLFFFIIMASMFYLLILWFLKIEWVRQIPSIIFKNYG